MIVYNICECVLLVAKNVCVQYDDTDLLYARVLALFVFFFGVVKRVTKEIFFELHIVH